ncbi:hypothetical protein HYDPIDRAFT_33174 [Hydnomerulius pinastri MD-312]|uniref:DUF6534 domain-containing protein n=1 Tax=Hydnomerulius pinastri MD-312 TaxID=994086 RepID=A0A0C9W9E7_9AGAM|nr:hypothetical protein HYDPIDRAFT_33174 [Hydnomerulius pinastri MD-312]
MSSTSLPIPPALFPPVNLSSTIGTGYWGLIVASVLLGCTMLQVYFYFRNNKDGWGLKSLVITLCAASALDTLSWAFFAYVYYYYLVKNFGNDLVLLNIPWPFGAEVFVEVVAAYLSQLFFAWQIYGFNKKSWPISAVIATFATVAFGSGIAVGVYSVQDVAVNSIGSKTTSVVTDINKGFATACDIVCQVLSYASDEFNLNPPFTRTNSMITLLIIYIVNRGVLLTLVQGTDLLLFVCAPNQDTWVPFHMCLSKVYVNTLLAMLNARSTILKNDFSSISLGETQSSSNYSSEQRPTFTSHIPTIETTLSRKVYPFTKDSKESFHGQSGVFQILAVSSGTEHEPQKIGLRSKGVPPTTKPIICPFFGEMNSTSVPLLFPPLDLSTSVGPSYWALLIISIFLGCTELQTYFYFRNYNDGWPLKSLVAFMCTADNLGWAFLVQAYYSILVKNFGNPLAILTIPMGFAASDYVTMCIELAAQLFFASQVYGVHRQGSWPAYATIIVFAIASFGVAILSTGSPSAASVASRKVQILNDINVATSLICDAVAAGAMCFYLTVSRTNVARTNSVISSLILYVVNRGILLAVVQGANLILYIYSPSKDYWIPVHMLVGKIYTNTLLAMLNARSTLRDKMNDRLALTELQKSARGRRPFNSDRSSTMFTPAGSQETMGKRHSLRGPSDDWQDIPRFVDIKSGGATEEELEGPAFAV